MKRKVANLIVVVVACLTLSTVLVSINSLSVSAEGQLSAQDLTNKVLLNAIKTCYTDKYMKTEIDAKDYSSFANLFTKDGTKDGVIKVPTMVGNTLTDSDVSCKEVFLGYRQGKGSNSITGLFSAYGKTSAINDLPYLGFDHENGENPNNVQEGCLGFSYARPDPNSSSSIVSETNQVCFRVSGASGKETIELNNDDPATYRGEANGPISIYYDSLDRAIYISTPPEVNGNYKWQLSGSSSWTTIKQDFQSYVENALSVWVNYATSENLGYQLRSMTSTELGETTYFDKYTKRGDNGGAGALRALRYITSNGGTTWDSIKFTDEDIYNLYLQYYNNTVNKYQSVYTGDCYDTEEAAKTQSAYYIQSSDKKWCTVYGVSQVTEKFNMVADSRDKLVSGDSYDFAKVLTRLVEFSKVIDTSTVAPDINEPTTPSEPDNGSSGDGISCFTNAASLGWILCPVLQVAGATTDGLYGWIEQDWLSITPDEVSANSGQGVYEAWKKFRDFTNIIFAILIIIIILSQVTGFGVSNYGVKKLLPTVIVVAILVNISFFLCQVCVDLSNIVGESIRSIFSDMQIAIGGKFDFGATIKGLFATVGVAWAGYTASGWAIMNPDVWMLPLLLVVITAIIAIIIFFITLAVRKAGIYILIVLSPVAIICYALPNTKKIFDRWLKMFSSLLLVYPICGLFMGGGSFAAKVILGSGDDSGFVMALVGVMLQVIPFFFIPSILRSSMTALGNIGTRLANFGNRLGKTITTGVAHSDAARRFNTSAAAWGAQTGSRVAGSMRGGLRRIPGIGRAYRAFDNSAAGKALSKNRRLRGAASIAKYNKMQQEDYMATKQREQMVEGSDAYNNMIATIDREYDAAQTKDMMNALINDPDYNHNDLTNLENDLSRTLVAIDNAPEDKKLQYRAKAITDLMMKVGPNGQDALMRAVKGHTYNKDGLAGTRSVGNNTVLNHLDTDSRYRPAIKAGNYGDDKFITDYLGGGKIKDRSEYETMSKNSAQAMANGTDDFYTNMIARIKGGDFNGRLGELNKIDEAATRALQDTKISGGIDSKVANWLNEIRKGAYDARKQDYINEHIGEYMTNDSNSGRPRTDLEAELGRDYEREHTFNVINPALYIDRS